MVKRKVEFIDKETEKLQITALTEIVCKKTILKDEKGDETEYLVIGKEVHSDYTGGMTRKGVFLPDGKNIREFIKKAMDKLPISD